MNKLTTVEKLDKKQSEGFFSEALNIEKTWPNLKQIGENIDKIIQMLQQK